MSERFEPLWVVLSMLVLVWVSAACVGLGFGLEDLPPDPIAVLYWDEADAKSRLEIEQAGPNRPRGPSRQGVARFDDIRAWVQGGTLVPGFDDYPGQLVLVDPRSGEMTPVEGAPPGAQPLSWSADRERLMFTVSRRGQGSYGLFEYFVRDGEVRPVVPGTQDESHSRGDYGPDGAVAYSTFDLETQARPSVWVRPSRGRAHPIAFLFAETLRWSPRDQLVVVGERSMDLRARGARAWQIHGFSLSAPAQGIASPEDPDDRLPEPQRLGAGRHPTFSPDGAWIVYSAPAGGGWRLQRMRPDGSARSPVGRGVPSRNEQMPSVSPDGRYVAFVADEGGLARLFVRAMDGSGERFLLGHGAVSVPVW